jgi:hypothetical protein
MNHLKAYNLFNNFIKENLSDEQVLTNLNNMKFSDENIERFMEMYHDVNDILIGFNDNGFNVFFQDATQRYSHPRIGRMVEMVCEITNKYNRFQRRWNKENTFTLDLIDDIKRLIEYMDSKGYRICDRESSITAYRTNRPYQYLTEDELDELDGVELETFLIFFTLN